MTRLVQRLGSMARSRSLQASVLIAFGGAAFSLGNLFLARGLLPQEYGRFALMVAIVVVSGSVAPAGLDQLLLRRDIPISPRFLANTFLSASATALLFGVLAAQVYGLPLVEVGLLSLTTLTIAFLRLAACALRRHGGLMTSVLVDTSSDWILLLIGSAALATWAVAGAEAAMIGYAGGLLVTTALAWIPLTRLERVERDRPAGVNWREALPLFGIVAAGAVLVQAERMLIPLLLDLSDLAVFAVLAALVIAPFRVLGSGIITSLTQQVRVADSARARLRAVRQEMVTCAVLMGLATLAICVLGPLVARLLTSGRYELTLALMAGACANGVAKVIQAFPRAIVTGAGTTAELQKLNGFIWLSVAGTIAGALLGHWAGLVGLMAGAALGSLAATAPAVILAHRLLCGPVQTLGRTDESRLVAESAAPGKASAACT